eukprot:tig00021135_g18957.t1
MSSTGEHDQSTSGYIAAAHAAAAAAGAGLPPRPAPRQNPSKRVVERDPDVHGVPSPALAKCQYAPQARPDGTGEVEKQREAFRAGIGAGSFGQHVFVSYRRNGGDDLAHLIYRELRRRCYSVFLDVKQLAAGHFGEDLKKELAASCCVVLVLTQSETRDPENPARVIRTTTLDRCRDPRMRDNDWVRKEIVFALQNDTPIIPVLKDFRMPDEWGVAEYPEDMQGLFAFNGVKWDHELSNGTMERLCQFVKAAVQRKCAQWKVPPEIFYRPDATAEVLAEGASRELQRDIGELEARLRDAQNQLRDAQRQIARLQMERDEVWALYKGDRQQRERELAPRGPPARAATETPRPSEREGDEAPPAAPVRSAPAPPPPALPPPPPPFQPLPSAPSPLSPSPLPNSTPSGPSSGPASSLVANSRGLPPPPPPPSAPPSFAEVTRRQGYVPSFAEMDVAEKRALSTSRSGPDAAATSGSIASSAVSGFFGFGAATSTPQLASSPGFSLFGPPAPFSEELSKGAAVRGFSELLTSTHGFGVRGEDEPRPAAKDLTPELEGPIVSGASGASGSAAAAATHAHAQAVDAASGRVFMEGVLEELQEEIKRAEIISRFRRKSAPSVCAAAAAPPGVRAAPGVKCAGMRAELERALERADRRRREARCGQGRVAKGGPAAFEFNALAQPNALWSQESLICCHDLQNSAL